VFGNKNIDMLTCHFLISHHNSYIRTWQCWDNFLPLRLFAGWLGSEEALQGGHSEA